MDPNVIVAVKLDEIEDRIRELTAAVLAHAAKEVPPSLVYERFNKFYDDLK